MGQETALYDIEQIRAVLPHRYPMLLVDRILELDPGKRAIGLKNVTINEDFFNGHFPGQAMMPGVLILEAMAQVAGILVLTIPGYQGKLAVIAGAENVRFRKPVVPGDALVSEVEVLHVRKVFGKVRLTARVNEEIVASCEMTFGLLDPGSNHLAPALGAARE